MEKKADTPAAPMGFVRGGGSTGTQKSEDLFKARFADAERRRDQADFDKKVSARPKEVAMPGAPLAPDGTPIKTKFPGGTVEIGGKQHLRAVQYESRLTNNPNVPLGYILLTYYTRAGAVAYHNSKPIQCCADLIIGARPAFPTELCLILVCPRCVVRSHKSLGDCQIRIFDGNRHISYTPPGPLDPPEFVFEGERYKSLGTIQHVEPFECPDCSWKATIENNKVRTIRQ